MVFGQPMQTLPIQMRIASMENGNADWVFMPMDEVYH
jgi:hypothetical protein